MELTYFACGAFCNILDFLDFFKILMCMRQAFSVNLKYKFLIVTYSTFITCTPRNKFVLIAILGFKYSLNKTVKINNTIYINIYGVKFNLNQKYF